MRMVTAVYNDGVRKAKANMIDRYIATAQEKDLFWRAVKKQIVFPDELR
jgi:hypothetical protein